MTLEDQIQLKTAEDLRSRVREQTAELIDQKARMESQVLLLKMQLIEQISKSERRKGEIVERLREIKRECELSPDLEDGEIIQPLAKPLRK